MANRDTPSQQLTILDAMLLIAGVALGLWMFREELGSEVADALPIALIAMLGGCSLAGGPMLIVDRLRGQRRWRSGALMWFAMSLGCWLLAPAIVLVRLKIASDEIALTCFVYSIPLMGLSLAIACLAVGRPVREWWRCRGWWPEWFGMWMLVGWAGMGIFVLFQIYNNLSFQ